MANIRKKLEETFGYSTNLKSNSEMHDGPTENKKTQPASWMPIEKFRNVIKALMGHLTTEEEGKIEDTVDFVALHRLFNKHGFAPAFLNQLNTIQLELDKPKSTIDRKAVMDAWNVIKENIPFWFLGLLPHKDEMPEEDKKNLANLMDIMAEINKIGKEVGEERAKDTEHAGRDSSAKKALDKARKDRDMSTDAASEKKMNKKSEIEIKDKK